MLSALLAVFLIIPVTDDDTLRVSYARDGEHEYFGTPNGLYRDDVLIAFKGERINEVVVHEGRLYVLKPDGRVLLRSDDQGATFTPIDDALLDCALLPCTYLQPTHIAFAAQQIYLAASGNVLASSDGGATWRIVFGLPHDGKPTAQICPVTFEPIDGRVLMGGECPLDVAWLRFDSEPNPITPQLENRNIQFIRRFGDIVFAGIEGGLLKSTDRGASFRFVLQHTQESSRYAYIQHIVVTPDRIVVAGFDKKNVDAPYLAYSTDGGETWIEATSQLPRGTLGVVMLAEDREGKIIAAMRERESITIRELRIAEAPKRRALGR